MINPRKLNVGSGPWKKVGYVNIDKLVHENVDIVHDLNIVPWPVEAASISHVYACNILEHLEDPVQIMEELWRIMPPDGTATIIVPYYNSTGAFRDPTHKRFFTESTMDYFSVGRPLSHYNYYSSCRFELLNVEFHPVRKFFLILPRRLFLWLAHNFVIVHSLTFQLRKPENI